MGPCLGEPLKGQDGLASSVHWHIQSERYRNSVVIAGVDRRVGHGNGRKYCFQHLERMHSLDRIRRVRHCSPFNSLSIHEDIATIAHIAGFNSRDLGLLSIWGVVQLKPEDVLPRCVHVLDHKQGQAVQCIIPQASAACCIKAAAKVEMLISTSRTIHNLNRSGVKVCPVEPGNGDDTLACKHAHVGSDGNSEGVELARIRCALRDCPGAEVRVHNLKRASVHWIRVPMRCAINATGLALIFVHSLMRDADTIALDGDWRGYL